MSLNRLFRLISIALLLLFLAFAVSLVWTEWNNYRNGANSVPALRQFRLALIALEKLSAERGPANAFMGASASQREALSEKLQAARGQTDAALAELVQALQSHPRLRQSWSLDRIKTVQQALGPARAAIDRIGRQPESERNNLYVLSAVGGMVDMIPLMIRVSFELSSQVDRADPQLRGGLSAIRAASSLREYAGQVGSRFAPALIAHRKLTQEEVIEIGRLYGRIELLRNLLNTQMADYVERPEFARALDLVEKQYFENGFQLLDFLLQAGLKSGDYGMTPVDLFRFYVPQMKSITDLRDLLLDDMMEQAQQHNRRARNYLLLVIVVTVVACLFFQLLMVLIRRRVVQPLVQATDLVSGLVEGRLDQEIPRTAYEDEISAMMRALKVLRQRMRERNSLAREREALIAQLQMSSNTDFLTGVLNRRAFFTHGQQQMTVAQRYGRELAVVLFDIDHFKQINDTHGHIVGDAVLRQLSLELRRSLRENDLAGRYGGDEFCVILPKMPLEKAAEVMERIRETFSNYRNPQIPELRVSLSIGLAGFQPSFTDAAMWLNAADRALYTAKDTGRNRVNVSDERVAYSA